MNVEFMKYKQTLLHNNNFDLIRLVLAGSVILSHSWKFIAGNYDNEPLYRVTGYYTIGDVAVDGFFLLSGYLIFSSWIRKPQIVNYIWKRVLRIFPGFVVVSILSVALGSYIYGYDIGAYLLRLRVFLDAFTLGEPVGPFKGEQLNVSLWTIRYEFICYVMVAGMGLFGFLKNKWPTTIVWIIAMGVTGSGIITDKSLVGSLVRFIPFFITGGMFFLFRDTIHYRKQYAFIALAGILFAFFSVRFSRVLLPLTGGYLLFYTGFLKSEFVKKLKPANDISYGLYLYGWPIQKFLVVSFAVSSPWLLFVVSLPLAAFFGFLSWKLVEEPCIRMKTGIVPIFKRSEKKDVFIGNG